MAPEMRLPAWCVMWHSFDFSSVEKLRSLYTSQPVANVSRSAITFESILNMPNRMSSSGECVCVCVQRQAMELSFTHKRTHTIPFKNNYKQKHSHRIKSNYLRKWTLNETESTRELRAKRAQAYCGQYIYAKCSLPNSEISEMCSLLHTDSVERGVRARAWRVLDEENFLLELFGIN